jgi:hypothetical protein
VSKFHFFYVSAWETENIKLKIRDETSERPPQASGKLLNHFFIPKENNVGCEGKCEFLVIPKITNHHKKLLDIFLSHDG